MDYQDIEIFLTIVATKSITKAADILFYHNLLLATG